MDDVRHRLTDALDQLKAGHRTDPMPSADVRKDRLLRLEKALLNWEDRLVEAMVADFGPRAGFEARTFDITLPLGQIRTARRRVARWMKKRPQRTPLHFWPAKVFVQPTPKGVVGILSPWNYPVLLLLGPLADALAAGNRAMLKPSEWTPRTSAALGAMIADAFDPAEVALVEGDADLAAAFSELPFDHLVFTGSTAVGAKVARAAAMNMVPVTLELGGKSPMIIGQTADVDHAVQRLVFAAFLNGGQTCVGVDYALFPEGMFSDLVEATKREMSRAYPDGGSGDSFSGVISDERVARLDQMLEEARASGAEVWQVPGDRRNDATQYPPTLVLNPSPDLALMQEEIFGPILPLFAVRDHNHAAGIVGLNPDPLSLYVFSRDRTEIDFWTNMVRAGGVGVNECMLQLVTDTLPFGGIGTSGQGALHGRWGFDTLSHLKAVFVQRRPNVIAWAAPPHGRRASALAKVMRRLV